MKLIKAPYISQEGKYPTGCEIISAVMLLNYLGFFIDGRRIYPHLPGQKRF